MLFRSHINNKKTFVELGKIYGVVDNTVKKWITIYEKDLNITQEKCINSIIKENKDKEKANDQKPIKEKINKNYVPIKYQNKSKINFNKVFLIIFIISIIGIIFIFENKEYILSKNPNFIDFFSLLEEFVEYLKQYYSDIIETLTPKQK